MVRYADLRPHNKRLSCYPVYIVTTSTYPPTDQLSFSELVLLQLPIIQTQQLLNCTRLLNITSVHHVSCPFLYPSCKFTCLLTQEIGMANRTTNGISLCSPQHNHMRHPELRTSMFLRPEGKHSWYMRKTEVFIRL